MDYIDALRGLLCILGIIVFVVNYMRYRNIRERHRHEADTPTRVTNTAGYDNLSRRLTGQSSSRISGANGDLVRGSLVGGGFTGGPGGAVTDTLVHGLHDFLP